jgi:hypothetical protein
MRSTQRRHCNSHVTAAASNDRRPCRPRWRSARFHGLLCLVHALGWFLSNDVRSPFGRCASATIPHRGIEVTGTEDTPICAGTIKRWRQDCTVDVPVGWIDGVLCNAGQPCARLLPTRADLQWVEACCNPFRVDVIHRATYPGWPSTSSGDPGLMAGTPLAFAFGLLGVAWLGLHSMRPPGSARG